MYNGRVRPPSPGMHVTAKSQPHAEAPGPDSPPQLNQTYWQPGLPMSREKTTLCSRATANDTTTELTALHQYANTNPTPRVLSPS
jgi:hypothetical protein